MKTNRGYIALISVLIISSLLLLIGAGLTVRSIGESQMSLNEQKSCQALSLADTCAHIALLKLKNTLDYIGNEDIIVEGQTCTIFTISGSGNSDRMIQTQGSVSGYVRRVQVHVSEISPTTKINLWKEVANF